MKQYILIIALLMSSFQANAQRRWWSFTNNGWTACKSVELPDHNYLSIGAIDKRFDGLINPITRAINLIRMDKNGLITDSSYIRINKIDTTRYIITECSFYSGQQLIDGYVYMGINVYDTNYKYTDYLIRFAWDAKSDSNGFIYPEVITKIQSGNYLTNIYTIIKDSFNHYLVLSFYENSSNSYVDYTTLTCYDSAFHQLWLRDFKVGAHDDMFPEQLIADGRGGYLLVCQRQIYYRDIEPNIYQQYVYDIDSMGNTLWTLPFINDSFSLYNMRIAPMGNDSFAAFYTDTYTNGNLYMQPYLQQANYNSTLIVCPFSIAGKQGKERYLNQFLQWKLGGFNGFNSDISWDEAHNIYILGSYFYNSDYGYLIKFKADLSPVWLRSYDILPQNHPNPDDRVSNFPYTLTPTSDKGFLLTGEYQSDPSALFPKGTQQGMVIKVDSFGCLAGGCEIHDDIPQVWNPQQEGVMDIYPNPAVSKVYIQYNLMQLSGKILTLMDITGRVLKHIPLNGSSGSIALSVEDLPSGVYILSGYAGGRLFCVQKLIIAR